ncbi:MAG: hypothetical protein PHW69_08385 [Elusimicrobiaceae bacterium]|nr:hypothetical protein [Elusimicrobiaceae bacterium]
MLKRTAVAVMTVFMLAGAGAMAQDFDFNSVSGAKVKALKQKLDTQQGTNWFLFPDLSSDRAAAVPFDEDVPPAIQAQIRDDMAFIGTIQSSDASGLHRKIFGPVDGRAYLDFFNSRVKGIGMDDCGSAIAVACVIPFVDSSKMWLTQNYIKFSHPQISRLMVVFHESRHTETSNGNWSHARCPRPFVDADGKPITSIWTGSFLAGEAACDSTPYGSYGSSLIMLKNIQKFCTNCTDKVRMDAGIYADDQFKRITSASAIKAIKADLY